jgi:hypothetical protein
MMSGYSYFGAVLYIISLAWVIFVPILCGVNNNANTVVYWLDRVLQHHRSSNLILIAFVLVEVILIPVSLVLPLRLFWKQSRLEHLLGPTVGVMYGLWTITLLLTLPYIGSYPNLPGILLGSILSRGTNQGAAYYLGTFCANTAIGSVVGWIIFRGLQRPTKFE